MIEHIDERNFYDIIKHNDVVLVDFTSKYCAPCKLQERELVNIDRQFGNKIKIISVEISRSPKLASKFGIVATPTLMFFKKGKKVRFTSRSQGRIDRFIGLRQARQLVGPINFLLNMKV